MTKRLSAQAWIDFALATLAREGFEALKADVLARKLGVSRGSFYWHFEDIETFHTRVIQRWRQVATEAIIADVERQQGPDKRLDVLLRHAFGEGADLEVGMRAWADNNGTAERALRQVDRRRRTYIAQLLRGFGVPAPLAAVRTSVLYWTYLGAAVSHNRLSGRDLDQIVAQLMWFARS
jgi:AcrR family transcriptional regulator